MTSTTGLSNSSVASQGTQNAQWVRQPCRSCGVPLTTTFVDLGMSPLCESFLTANQLNQSEAFYPLHVYVCGECFLVQLEEFVSPDSIFNEYAYFSSFSDSWLAHAAGYVDKVVKRFGLNEGSFAVELASNDGYLLRNFVKQGIPCLGIEPAANVALAAEKVGVPSLVRFFDQELARELASEGKQADLIIGNNVLAQVPALNGFVAGIKTLLKPRGVVTLEFPHLLRLMDENQFDTIYHEHFSYFSLIAVERIVGDHGLRLFDVEELSTHGGSLRIYACHSEDPTRSEGSRVTSLRERELNRGLTALAAYSAFGEQVRETKRKLLEFLISAKRAGKSVVGYGAPGKGNTLLNYCGIGVDFLDYTVDRNPYKHGRYLPGSHIPVFPPERLRETRPDYVLILPWNLKDEIVKQCDYIREWGGKFVVPIPEAEVIE